MIAVPPGSRAESDIAGPDRPAAATRMAPPVDNRAWTPAGFPAARFDHLRRLEADHFWFRARRRLCETLLQRLIPRKQRAGLELGCGTGSLLPLLTRHARTVVGVDAYRVGDGALAGRGDRVFRISADVLHVPLCDNQFDFAVALDVLEHVEPLLFLREVRRLVRPGGTLLLSVPASPRLWSHADEVAGHRVRYRFPMLRDELQRAGWTPLGHTHYQCLLYPLLLLSRRTAPRSLRAVERHPPQWVSRLLGAVNMAEVTMLRGARLPFGSSLFCWARCNE